MDEGIALEALLGIGVALGVLMGVEVGVGTLMGRLWSPHGSGTGAAEMARAEVSRMATVDLRCIVVVVGMFGVGGCGKKKKKNV